MKKIDIILTISLAVLLSIESVPAATNVGAQLKYTNGKDVNLATYKGKVVVLDFWFTGCLNCMQFYSSSLSKAEKQFANNKDVVFISVCIDKDKDKWLASIEKGKYTSKRSINVYTCGFGDQDEIIKQYNISSYPQPIIIDKKGKIVSRSAKLTERNTLIQTIRTALN